MNATFFTISATTSPSVAGLPLIVALINGIRSIYHTRLSQCTSVLIPRARRGAQLTARTRSGVLLYHNMGPQSVLVYTVSGAPAYQKYLVSTIDQEVELVWKVRWSLGKVIFIIVSFDPT